MPATIWIKNELTGDEARYEVSSTVSEVAEEVNLALARNQKWIVLPGTDGGTAGVVAGNITRITTPQPAS
jgi:hypothetical protein